MFHLASLGRRRSLCQSPLPFVLHLKERPPFSTAVHLGSSRLLAATHASEIEINAAILNEKVPMEARKVILALRLEVSKKDSEMSKKDSEILKKDVEILKKDVEMSKKDVEISRLKSNYIIRDLKVQAVAQAFVRKLTGLNLREMIGTYLPLAINCHLSLLVPLLYEELVEARSMNSLQNGAGRFISWKKFLLSDPKGRNIAKCIHAERFWVPRGASKYSEGAKSEWYIARRIAAMYGTNNDKAHADALCSKFEIGESAAGPPELAVALCIAEEFELAVSTASYPTACATSSC